MDQYKLFCAELEVIIKSCASTPYHKKILENIQNVRAACGDATVKSELDATSKLLQLEIYNMICSCIFS